MINHKRAALVFTPEQYRRYPPGTFAGSLHVLALQARQVVGAHQSALSYIPDGDFQKAIHTHSFSDKYEQYNTYDVMPTGHGIWSAIIENRETVRMTDTELKLDSRWRNFSDMKDARDLAHPPMRGWLAVPVLDDRGERLFGIVQVTDKYEGDFDEADQRRLEELAQVITPFFSLQYTALEQAARLERDRRIFLAFIAVIAIISIIAYIL